MSSTSLPGQLDQSDLPYCGWNDNVVLYIYGPTGLVMEFNRTGCSTLLFDPQGSCVCSSNAIPNQGEFYTVALDYAPNFYDAYGLPVLPQVAPPSGPGSVPAFSTTSAQPFQYKGQYGYYTDSTTGLCYCINRYYDPNVGRWTSRDPSGLDGGVNVYGYVNGNPVTHLDPDGLSDDDSSFFDNFFGDWSWSRYFGDMGQVALGELAAINPVHAAKGIGSTVGYLVGRGGSKEAFTDVGIGFLHGLAFWERDDPEAWGESFMGDLLILAPLGKKIPNFTPLKLSSRFPLANGGATLIRIDWKGSQLGRLEIHPLPASGKLAAKIPAAWRGKTMLHYHRRGPGGIERHRHWEAGNGPRF